MGETKGKGIMAVVMLGGLILLIIGYRNAGFVNVWIPPAFMVHIANLLILIGFWFFALSAIPGTMSARVRFTSSCGCEGLGGGGTCW